MEERKKTFINLSSKRRILILLGRNLNVLHHRNCELTAKSLQPLLPSSPSQHQQPDEDDDDAHQHAGDGDHHLHAFATARDVLAHSGSLHQWRNGA